MAKFYGVIGYAETTEQAPGVWTESIVEKNYYGDILKISRRLQSTENVNDDVVVNNQISIVADPYAFLNFMNMRYVVWMGVKWKVTNIDVQSPRLILTLGGIYNGH